MCSGPTEPDRPIVLLVDNGESNPFPVLRREGHFDVKSRTPSGIHIDHQFFRVSLARAKRSWPIRYCRLPEVDIETGNDVI